MFAHEKETSVARRIAIAEIDRAVAGRLGTTRVLGNAQPAVFNRQVAMYLAKALSGWSVTKIGKFYNGRHHTTVCYAIRRIEALRAINAEVDGLVKALAEEIKSSPARDRGRRIHFIEGRPAPIQSAAITEEFLDAWADRLMSRLRSSMEEVLLRRVL